MGCCSGMMKTILFVFNFVFALSGIGLITIGSILINGIQSDTLTDITNFAKAPPITFIVVGCIVFVVAFLGCCGAQTNSRWMLIMYSVILIIVLIIQLVIGIYVLVKWTDNGIDLTEGMNKQFKDHPQAFHDLEVKFECCGVRGTSDYLISGIPPSCCPGNDSTKPCTTLSLNLYRVGCATKVENWLIDNSKIIGGVGIGFCVIELVGIIFACSLSNHIKNH